MSKQALEDTPARRTRPTAGGLPALELVVALAANAVIGDANRLPWHLPADLRRFRRLTTGHAIVMGRKTWESIGRALPQRQAIVISRQPGFSAADAEVASSLQQALAQARLPSPVYCIGGGEIFAIALPHATRMHVTEIAAAFPGDAFFPDFDRSGWRETFRETHAPGGEASFGYAFVTYDRVRAEAGTA